MIHIGKPIPFDTDVFLRGLHGLMTAAYDGREDIIRALVCELVSTFRPETCADGQTETRLEEQADIVNAKFTDALAVRT